MMPEDYLKNSEEVGIEWGLIEDVLADPIPGSDPLCPFIVRSAIAGEIIEKRDRIDFNQIEQTENKCAAENDPKPDRICRQRDPALRLDRGTALLCSRPLVGFGGYLHMIVD